MSTTLGALSVGSVVYLEENGVEVAFRVIHQGLPSSLYDSSCNGTWVMRIQLAEQLKYATVTAGYKDCIAHSYVNEDITYRYKYDDYTQSIIKTVKIPYSDSDGKIYSGADGLSCERFLLSVREVGATKQSENYNNPTLAPIDGAKLDYFSFSDADHDNNQNYNQERWATNVAEGVALSNTTVWYLRTPNPDHGAYVVLGTGGIYRALNMACYTRYAMVLDPTAKISADGRLETNSAPTTPSSITIPSTIKSTEQFAISWGSSTDTDGNLSGYTLERSLSGGSWSQVYKGSSTSTTDTVPFGTLTVQYRVCAYDSDSATSDYKSSNLVTVINNTPPKISDSDRDLGAFTEAFTLGYTVTDDEGGNVTVSESVDDKELYSYTASLGVEKLFSFAQNDWARVSNGSHVLNFTATDSEGELGTRNFTFSKLETQIHLEYTSPFFTDSPTTVGILTIKKYIADGATFSVEVCNNALDTVPTWENVTAAVNLGGRFYLNNDTKTATKWAYQVRIKVDRNTATEDSWISDVEGYYR